MKIEMNGLTAIDVERTDDEAGMILVTIKDEDGTVVKINAGRFHDDAIGLRDLLAAAAADITDNIITGWEDRPEDYDAFVTEVRGGYSICIEGTGPDTVFPNRDVATYELAALMAKDGCFPNAWFVNERGNIDDIGEDVRKYHDEGGDGLLPLDGVMFERGTEVQALVRIQTGPFIWEQEVVAAEIIRDYGTLGVVYCYSGDGGRHFTDDRDNIRPYPEESNDG